MNESGVLTTIRNALGRRRDVRLFRNQCGFYKDGDRAIRYGIPGPGGSDLLGWKTIEITAEDIGKRVCVFVAIEVKASNGKTTKEQDNFLLVVKAAGGISGVARSVEEAEKILCLRCANI